MIPRMKPVVFASVLGLGAVHCGGSSTPPSSTPQPYQDESGSYGTPRSPSEMSSSAAPGSEPGAMGPGASSDTGATQASGATSSTARSPSTHSEWTSDERMPVAGRDEGDTAPEGSRGGEAAPLTDAQIAGVMDFVNNAEIQQAQLAQSKSKNPAVLSFASMMIAQHSQAKQQQSALGLSTAGSSTLQRMSSDGQRTLASLRDKSGKDFDRAYLQAQIDQHQKALDTLDRQLLPSTQNAQFRSHLTNMRSTLQQHLQSAREAMKSVEGQQSSGGQRSGTGSATQP